ncbi:transcription elongation factor TFIIS-like [Cynara cardunculus var. scolymus]|uniref:Transcription elongation factor n=1 Tax=Cynara cardunculus var. scolymus TaxID=59895 RepID=A0A103YDI1_CYNCS|nr:transcription elongation factor TFIIS-like [Cynara cardunculus var. scolymus]KVI07086.1 Transcription elongation factor S-II, central domain-containing protein [Cynara cardunculus var. scolymus]
METELIELFDAVKKAADAAALGAGGTDYLPEEDRCLDALKVLKKFPVNYHILVSTQVGKRLRQLTKHPRKKIQSLASELVEIWKGVIVEETLKNKKNGNMDVRESPKEMSEKKVDRVNSIKAEKVSKTENVKNGHGGPPISSEKKVNVVKAEKKEDKLTPEAKKPSTNAVAPLKLTSLVYCKDPVRDKIRELLAEALCKVPGEADEELRDEANACDPYRVAVSVESAMFEKWGRSNGAQKFKYRSIMFNIKDPKNPDFRRKILLGHVKPERILELTPEEMASTERQMQNVKIKEKALFECERGGPPKATTDQFRCGRCGKRKCTYYQLQTRSADEPMTTFVTCVNCDNHWKFC